MLRYPGGALSTAVDFGYTIITRTQDGSLARSTSARSTT